MKELMRVIDNVVCHDIDESTLTTCICCGRPYYTNIMYEMYRVCSEVCFDVEYNHTYDESELLRGIVCNANYLRTLNFSDFRSE